MNFKDLYTKNNIEYGCGRLYGPFFIAKDYSFSTNKKGMKTVLPVKNDEYSDYFFAEVDEYDFFFETLKYGKALYNKLSNEIELLPCSWKIPKTFDDSYLSIIPEQKIIDSFDNIKDICVDFMQKYTTGVVFERFFPVDYKANLGTPISFFINHILLIYMLNTVFENLSNGYNHYKNIYTSLSITSDMSDSEILDKITEYINIYSLPFHNIMVFNLELLKIDGNIIPITKTNNIFTFAFEVLQNNISTRSFYEFDGANDVHSYNIFRKCARCLKNTVDLETDRQIFYTTLKYKRVYCDDCKKELKRISSNKYEHSIRTLYDELKNNIDKCNPKLANEIKNLLPKDKETKTHLEKLYNEYQRDITKIDKNKESDRT